MAAGDDTPQDDQPDQPEEADEAQDDDSGDEQSGEDESRDDDHQGDDDEQGGDGGSEDISGTTAPSIGPNTTFEREDPEERLARHEQSDVDAMGLDKRREVVGGSYGASFGKQATLYGGVLVIVAVLVVGFIILVGQLDKPRDPGADEAPWSEQQAEQVPVEPIDNSKP